MLDKHNEVGFELRELMILLSRVIDQEAAARNVDKLKGPQAWALGFIKKNDDRAIYQKDIEEELSIRKPTASRLIDRMEKNGFVRRIPSLEDKRLKQIVLTKKAEKNMSQIDDLVQTVESRLKNGLSDEEIQTYLKITRRIKMNLENN